MKIFLIDKYGKNSDIANYIKKLGVENIETRQDCKIKATKNDYIIIFEDEQEENIPKTANIILITNNKDKKYIWNFVNKHNCADIIDATMDRNYISQRISTKISS